MISVHQAIEIIKNNIKSTSASEVREVKDAYGYTLFDTILSPINMPPFRQSAMDGYALQIHDSNTYTVIGEIKAGDSLKVNLSSGEAVRIFTGAPVPETANAIVIQEKVSIENNALILHDQVSVGDNIRPMGEQVKIGQIALEKKTRLSSAGIGFLSSLGVCEVKVYSKPSISIVVTGNELVAPGTQLDHGQIYESNAIMLLSTLNSLGYNDVSIERVADNYQNTVELLQQVLIKSDVIIISGGISVGDYDFVGKALIELGVNQLFYKVKQKPGKPLFFGKKGNTIVFALPGNPGSALSCFYIYVYQALQKLSGEFDFKLTHLKARSQSEFKKKGDRAQFLKAIYENGKVRILDGQNSSMLQSFSLANAFVFIPEDLVSVSENDELEIILIP
jgi:molybdopterin molybdotransferase